MADLVDDEEFLSLVDAIEADAMKRRKVNGSGGYSAKNSPNEGQYTAALRGSNSHLWQTSMMNTNTQQRPGEYSSYRGGAGGGGGECYKCKQPGHWAKDCVSVPVRPNKVDDCGSPVPERQCACDRGPCIVLTANTEQNRGRKFYKCPLKEGQCGFFEWCDATQSASGGYGTQRRAFSDDSSKRSEPYMNCICGAGPCLVLTAKTEKNMGRQFFRCPVKSGEGACSFFKWCDELNLTSDSSPFPTCGFPTRNDSTPVKTGRAGPSPCYNCGISGHWAKDCPKPSSAITVASGTGHGERSTAYNPCFKCGKTGHWAKDCHS